MRRVGWLGALALALVAVSGCGDRKHPVALQGTWKLTDLTHPLLSRVQNGAQIKKKVLAQAASTMTLKPTGEATGISKDVNVNTFIKWKGSSQTGTWEADGQNFKTTLSFTPGAQAPAEKKDDPGVPYTLSPDGKTLKFSKDQLDLTWTKQ
jgi:hypothetical protein